MSNLIRSHPRILSISEFFMSLASRAFIHREVDGDRFWRLLSEAGPSQRAVFRQGVLPEMLYDREAGRNHRDGLPPLLYVVLPHLTNEPEIVYRELEPEIRSRPRARWGEQVAYLFEWMCDRFQKDLWVERSGASLVFVPKMMQAFPDARFIHLYRDGRDVALSMSRHGPFRLFIRTWQRLRWLGIDVLKLPLGGNRMLAQGEKIVSRFVRMRRSMARPVPLELAGRFWSEMVEVGLKNLDRVPSERRLDLSYESLVGRPEETLRRLCSFIGPDLDDPVWVGEASRRPKVRPPRWLRLTKAEQEELQGGCQRGLRLLGYRE